MSTDINTQTPPPPQGHAAQGASSGSGVSVVGFQSGNAANTTAILLLIADLMKLSEFKNDLFTSQAEASSNIADDYSQSQIDLGNQEETELEIQGAFSMGMGAITGALGCAGMFEEMNVSRMEGETNASQQFVNGLDNKGSSGALQDEAVDSTGSRTEAIDEEDGIEMQVFEDHTEPDESEVQAKKEKMDARFEEMIKEIKSGEYKMTDGNGKSAKPASLKAAGENKEEFSDQDVVTDLSDDQLARLKAAGNERVTEMRNQLADAKQTLRMNFDKRQMASTANQGIMQGAGNIGAGIMKAQQGEQQADNTQYDAAQKQFQNLTQETEKQADQDVQSADGLMQLIPENARTDQANLTA